MSSDFCTSSKKYLLFCKGGRYMCARSHFLFSTLSSTKPHSIFSGRLKNIYFFCWNTLSSVNYDSTPITISFISERGLETFRQELVCCEVFVKLSLSNGQYINVIGNTTFQGLKFFSYGVNIQVPYNYPPVVSKFQFLQLSLGILNILNRAFICNFF